MSYPYLIYHHHVHIVKEDEKTGSGSQMMEIGRVSEIHDDKYIYIDKTISSEFNKISKEFTKLVVTIKVVLGSGRMRLQSLSK